MYTGTITYDFNTKNLFDNNQYQRLGKALEHIGWQYSDTSAFVIETDNYSDIALTLELLARSTPSIGNLSALTVAIQYIGNKINAPGATKPQNAYKTLMGLPNPSCSTAT